MAKHNAMRPKRDMLRWLRSLRDDVPFMDVALKYGDWFFGRANVSDYDVAAAWDKRRRPKPKDCFYNAQKFCSEHPEFSYWEGFYLIPGLPMHHAWVVMDDGQVVDFTLEAVLRKAKSDHGIVDETVPLYLGISVPKSFLEQAKFAMGDPIAELYHTLHPIAKRRRS